MAENYSSMSLDKLKKEQAKIEKAITAQEAKEKKEAMAKVVAIARETGIDLSELVNGSTRNSRVSSGRRKAASNGRKKTAGAKRGKVPPKYRNPADSQQTWTGRGKQPVWVREYVKSGGSLDDITI